MGAMAQPFPPGGEGAGPRGPRPAPVPPAAAAGGGGTGGTADAPGQVRRLRLSGISGTVARAREFAREALYDWGWLPAADDERRAAAEDALLIVSELVTNACLHTAGPRELRLRRGPRRTLRIEVSDAGGGTPAPLAGRRPGRPGGHGMFIVERLSRDWGVIEDSRPSGAGVPELPVRPAAAPGEAPAGAAGGTAGKTVWAELTAAP
ncbi:ATP-binding protein [Streptomyces aidingensis]|uniref:Histidine kinase-like ATPase domain-containing protein n=1 Tax=Streptomyces aidingensis TaxID=910347 RepID=A0A1I1GLW0_9ACTN|nr:ATP-binding protein [Streptomyces aidingensis]SFC12769.1 Histidine kinase-like ATPase domain-containing protein [Streptomyces aidingensis]